MANEAQLQIIVNGKEYQSLEKGLGGVARDIKNLPKDMITEYKRELKKFLDSIADVMEKRHSEPYTGNRSTAGKLHRRSGIGVASIRKSINIQGNTINTLTGEIGGIKRLAIHEFGGVVTPKSKKFLTIPLPAALDSSGVPIRQSARDWDNTEVIRSAGGRLMIIQRRGRRIIPLYILTKRVLIKKRLGMRDAVQRRLSDFADTLANVVVTEFNKELENA